MVKLIVNNVRSEIEGLDNQIVYNKIDDALSFYVQGYQFSKAYQSGWWDPKAKKWNKWDGKNHLLSKNRFNTGLLSKVIRILKSNRVDFEIDDQRKEVKFKRKVKIKDIEIRPYQDRVHDACLKHKGGIVAAATGSGKSIMITRLIAESNVKTMVYVIGVDLLYQMKETFEKFLGTEVGIIGDGQADIKKINVCSVWTAANALGKKYESFDDEDRAKKEKFNTKNAAKIAKAIKASEMAIFDECQFLATQTLQSINAASKLAYYKYGFSGTPFRDDGADLLLEAVCGEIIVEVTASELIHDGWLVPPTIHMVNVPEYKGTLSTVYPSIYKEYIVENEVRNDKIIKAALKLNKSGRKVLILVKNIKHGNILLSKFDSDVVIYFVKGDVDSDDRNRIRKEFIDGDIDIIIASVVYDQGVDLPNLDALILGGSGKSSGRALQRIGRVIRKFEGKKDAVVVDFIDNAKYLLKHTASRVDTYRRESGFKIKLPKRKGQQDGGKTGKKEKATKGKQLQTKNSGGKVSW